MVIYKKYGETFRKIRIQEGLPLSFFASVGISKSNLSDFETGKKMMSFDKVVIALQAMNVSLRNFETHLNDYVSCDSLDILYNIEEAYLLEDTSKLLELYELTDINGLQQLSYSIKILLNIHNVDDLELIVNFLYSVKIWDYQELSIFYIVMSYISPKEILDLLTNIKKYCSGIYHSKEHNRILTLVLCKASEILSQQNYKQQSKQIINIIIQYKLASTMFLKTILLATKGVWVLHFDSRVKGRNMIRKSLHIHDLAGFPTISMYYKKKYDKYIASEVNSQF